jgi:HEAT repeat protein
MGAAGSPSTGGFGIVLDEDLTRWTLWWEFNKNPFIRLKDAIHSNAIETGSDEFFMGLGRDRMAGTVLKPTERQIVAEVLPALKAVMESTEQRDIISSVLVAMAKAGLNHPDFDILPLMAERLTSGDQEIRETAALAMGISQMPEAVDEYLIHLVEDGETGRRLMDRGEVDYRTRSFAAYGLGLVSWATEDVDLKSRALAALQGILEDDSIVSRDVRVAAINGLGLIAPDPSSTDPKEQKLLADCLDALETYYLKPLGAGEQLIQAHVPPAIAKLLGPDGPADRVDHYKVLFLAELQGRGPVKRGSNDIYRSAALALGKLCKPNNGGGSDPDLEYSVALLQAYEGNRDRQARNFCLIALAQIGGVENRNELLKVLDRGQKAIEKPWAALALGVYAHRQFEAAEKNGRMLDPDPLIGQSLQRAILDNKNPDVVAALAVGLGLSRYLPAADDLRDLLEEYRVRDELAGYLCIGLALMGDRGARDQINTLVESSVRRPELLRQAAIALGKIGDKSVTEVLQNMLVDGGQNLAKMSAVATALGFIGDRRTLEPLRKMMFDESLATLSRAFAVVALGGVIDKEPLPWNSKIGVDMNYRANVETLADGALGILDIL